MTDKCMSVVWIGAGTGATITRIQTATGADTILTDMLAVSQADFNDKWEGDLIINSSPAPPGGQYPGLQQQCLLQFLCADNTTAILRLIAPSISIFLADGVTVDSTAIATLIADCVGNLESATGSLATAFLGGFLNAR